MNLRFEATASVRSKSLFASTVEGFAIGLVLAIVACAGSSPPVATRSSPRPIEDCRGATETGPNPPTLSPGVEFRKMTVDSKLRDYRLFRPPQLDPTKPVSLVVVLHGSPIDAAGFEDVIHFDQEATSDGFVTASPNGCGGFWSYTEGGSKVADEDFIRKVIADVMAEFQVSKVFAMGASGGSRVAYRLACDFADVITGMASVSGTMVLQDACSPTRPVSKSTGPKMHGKAVEITARIRSRLSISAGETSTAAPEIRSSNKREARSAQCGVDAMRERWSGSIK